MISMI